MPTSLDHLLPAADESLRCAEHARSIGIDPGGTAIRADRLVLVSTPLPWPKPALAHPLLEPLGPILAASPTPTRLLAFAPDGDDPSPIEVVVFDRVGASVTERHFLLDNAARLIELAQAIAASAHDWTNGYASGEWAPAAASILICTQGSHDVCCGSDGARFAADVEASLDVNLYRVSHTGGHRFAPTAMTLPDGRMWADLDLTATRAILARAGSAADLADRCRGWWGADAGPAQVAERAVLALEGWSLDDAVRTIEIEEGPDGASGETRFIVTAESAAWVVDVTLSRAVPTITCREPGGKPAKVGQEYAIRSISQR